MRGAPFAAALGPVLSGIIPAYAGSTRSAQRPYLLRRDHPRVCGEHLLSALALIVGVGSSPRMRGALTECDT